jgi:hypothetical protein
MGDIWENSPAKGAELILLLAIAYFADEEGIATETADTLARRGRMSTDSVYRAVPRLEEKGLLEVLQRGEGRAASTYRLPGCGRRLRQQDDVFELRDRNLRPQEDDASSRNLRQQGDGPALLPQSAATSGDASDRNLRQQSGSLPQSAATTDAPVEGTRAGAHARVGGLVGSTSPTYLPTHPADRARERTGPVDEDAAEFMASLELKRAPRIAEQHEIADLFAAKIAAGFTESEIVNSVSGNWEGVRDRVRVLIKRFKEMPDHPLRRQRAERAATRPTWECAACKDPVVGPVTAAARCPSCWNGASEHAKDQLAALAPAFADSLLAETRIQLEANGWRPEGPLVDILAAELMSAHDVPARAKQVLGKWDRQRSQAESQARGGAAA